MNDQPTNDTDKQAQMEAWRAKIRRTNGSPRSQLGRAAFAVGCLIAEGIIPVDLDDADSLQNIETAVRIVAAALRAVQGDRPEDTRLPFDF